MTQRCQMLYGGRRCAAASAAECAVGCAGERLRRIRCCAPCVTVLRGGYGRCLPCDGRHWVQLLEVSWDPGARRM